MARLFISDQYGFDGTVTVSEVLQRDHQVENLRDAAFHIQHAGAPRKAVFDMEGILRIAAGRKYSVTMPREEKRRAGDIRIQLCHQHIRAPMAIDETAVNALSFKMFLQEMHDEVHAFHFFRARLPVHELFPEKKHLLFVAIDKCIDFFYRCFHFHPAFLF